MTAPDDPAGATSPDASAPDDPEQLTDAGALEESGSAQEDMAQAAEEGDARLRLAEEQRPVERERPYEGSEGRS